MADRQGHPMHLTPFTPAHRVARVFDLSAGHVDAAVVSTFAVLATGVTTTPSATAAGRSVGALVTTDRKEVSHPLTT